MADQSITSATSAGKSTVPLVQSDKLANCIGAITMAANELNQFHAGVDGMQHITNGLMLAREGLLEIASVGMPAPVSAEPAGENETALLAQVRSAAKMMDCRSQAAFDQISATELADSLSDSIGEIRAQSGALRDLLSCYEDDHAGDVDEEQGERIVQLRRLAEILHNLTNTAGKRVGEVVAALEKRSTGVVNA